MRTVTRTGPHPLCQEADATLARLGNDLMLAESAYRDFNKNFVSPRLDAIAGRPPVLSRLDKLSEDTSSIECLVRLRVRPDDVQWLKHHERHFRQLRASVALFVAEATLSVLVLFTIIGLEVRADERCSIYTPFFAEAIRRLREELELDHRDETGGTASWAQLVRTRLGRVTFAYVALPRASRLLPPARDPSVSNVMTQAVALARHHLRAWDTLLGKDGTAAQSMLYMLAYTPVEKLHCILK